ncbi:MAG: hypothetical protein A2901_00575 [Elusimicrobia bacterium RIFCSPLOWO2_01_FULL_54_10]|nr:MAG: hypothetical protein A2901_00575 [Elusimicrobia bacterium RIFCSPLOWO2_01_FULL_54_10]
MYTDVTLRWTGSSPHLFRYLVMLAAGTGLAWWTYTRGWKSTYMLYHGREEISKFQAAAQTVIFPIFIFGLLYWR